MQARLGYKTFVPLLTIVLYYKKLSEECSVRQASVSFCTFWAFVNNGVENLAPKLKILPRVCFINAIVRTYDYFSSNFENNSWKISFWDFFNILPVLPNFGTKLLTQKSSKGHAHLPKRLITLVAAGFKITWELELHGRVFFEFFSGYTLHWWARINPLTISWKQQRKDLRR